MLCVIYAECPKLALYAECRYVEFRYAECHYAECHYAECRGAILLSPNWIWGQYYKLFSSLIYSCKKC
jgi:hypothetical protein